MYFVIGADLVPTESNRGLFINGDTSALIGEVLCSELNNASFRIFNLEIPLTDVESPIVKYGPNLIAAPDTARGYSALGVDLLTLANNHILDQGVPGLNYTLDTLDSIGIGHLGAGENAEVAAKPYIFNFCNRKIGVYACVEHEFSVAEDDKPGANPFDPLWSPDHVAEIKKRVDYAIVLYHGGKEHYRYPSPMLQKICRRFVDKGADLVLCQHSHCIGCEEKYGAGTIVYGQGNFIFDYSDSEYWQTGLLVKVEDDFTVSYMPLVKTGNGVRLAEGQKAAEILDGFRSRSEEIKNPEFVRKQYARFAESFEEYYLYALSGRRSLWFRTLNKLSKGSFVKWYLRRTYEAPNKARITNYVDCEAHRELLLCAMKNGYK